MAYGPHGGFSSVEFWPVSNTGTIAEGDMVHWDEAGQYITTCEAGDTPCGVALDNSNQPTSDAGNKILVETSTMALFEYPADTGTITAALIGKTMDVGGAQSINIDTSAQDCIYVTNVRLTESTKTVICRIKFDDSFAGIA